LGGKASILSRLRLKVSSKIHRGPPEKNQPGGPSEGVPQAEKLSLSKKEGGVPSWEGRKKESSPVPEKRELEAKLRRKKVPP